MLAVRVDALQDRRVGDLAVRLDKSVAGLVKLIKVTFLEGTPNLATAAVTLSIACSAHWSVGAAMIGAVSAGGLVTAVQVRSQEGIRISLNEQKAALGGSIAEMLGNLAYIRAAGMRPAEEQRLEEGAEGLRRTEFDHHKYMMTFHGAKELIEGLGFTLVVGVAINLALQGEISSGDILTLSMLYMKAAQPLSKMHGVFDGMHEAVIKIGAQSAVRDLPSDPGLDGNQGIEKGLTQMTVPVRAEGLGVTLSRGTVESCVLDGLSLDLERGKVVGLAGTSGSGKSTLLKVALGPGTHPRLRRLPANVRHGGAGPPKAGPLHARRLRPAGTLRPHRHPPRERGNAPGPGSILPRTRSLRVVPRPRHPHPRRRTQPQRGTQRQRLALAWVFLQKYAELIVLDEATSALEDNATESRVIEELHAHAAEAGRTVIMVAHMLTTSRKADRVLVMDKGRVAQDGTYADLSQKPGIFFDLLQYNNKGV